MNRCRRIWPVREYQSDLTGVTWQEYVSADGSARVAVWVQGYLSEHRRTGAEARAEAAWLLAQRRRP
jgi:hypothetical protein